MLENDKNFEADKIFAFNIVMWLLLVLGGMTKNVYHGIFLNYTGFTVYDGIYFFHA